MPRYFFHTADGGRQPDNEGVELADDNVARVEAVRYAGAVLQHQPDLLWSGRDFRVEVTRKDGALLFTIITLAVDAPPGAGGG